MVTQMISSLQDERNDGQILKDVLWSISEWKDRQQRKILHQLFHRFEPSFIVLMILFHLQSKEERRGGDVLRRPGLFQR